ALLALAVFWSLHEQASAADQAEHADEAIAQGTVLSRILQNMETGIRGYRLTGDSSFLEPYNSGRTQFARDLESTRTYVRDDKTQVERLNRVDELVQHWLSDVAGPEVTAGTRNAPEDVTREQLGRNLVDQALGQLDAYDQTAHALEVGRRSAVNTASLRSEVITFGGLGLVLLLAVGAGYWMLRSVVGPMDELVASALDLTHGDEGVSLNVRGLDQLGQLKDVLNRMGDSLQSTQNDLAERNRELEYQRQELEARNEEAHEQAEQLRASLVKVSASESRERTFNRVNELAGEGRTPREVARQVLPLLLDQAEAQIGAVLLCRPGGDLDVLATSGTQGTVWSMATGLAGRALDERRSVQARYEKPSGRLSGFSAEAYLCSELALPLPGDAVEALGVLVLRRIAPGEFTGEQIGFVNLLAAQLSLALQRALLVETVSREASRQMALNRINNRIRSSLDLEQITDLAAEEILIALQGSRCLIELQPVAGLGSLVRQHAAASIRAAIVEPSDHMLYGIRAIAEQQTVVVPDVQADPWLRAQGTGAEAWVKRNNVRAVLAEPLRLGDEIVGAIAIQQCDGPRRWQADEIVTLQAAAGEIALAIANARLYQQAQTALLGIQAQASHVEELNVQLGRERDLLQRERDTGRAVLEASDEAILMTAPEGAVAIANRRFSEFFSISTVALSEEWQQAMLATLADRSALEHLLAECLGDPDCVRQTEIEVVRPVARTLDLFTTPVTGHDGSQLGRLWIGRDVTKYKEVDRLKDELVGMVSHELRTPTASVLGFTELLLTQSLPESEQRLFLETIHADAERLSHLINEFLDLQRLESGRQDLDLSACVPSELVERALAPFRHQEKLHQFLIQSDEKLPPVAADADQIVQVLTNMLSNAAKYSPHGGSVTVSLQSGANAVRFEVEDQGLGIPPEALGRLFQKFYRVDNPDRSEIGGTGLGLAICKQLVESHGGTIGVESTHGVGSCFWFTLPAADIALLAAPSKNSGTEILPVAPTLVRRDGHPQGMSNEAEIAQPSPRSS
ncbi:MAG: ATP-binding protein, partial [Dehalococcoidia bacterium]